MRLMTLGIMLALSLAMEASALAVSGHPTFTSIGMPAVQLSLASVVVLTTRTTSALKRMR